MVGFLGGPLALYQFFWAAPELDQEQPLASLPSIVVDCRSQLLPVQVVGDVYALDTRPGLLRDYITHSMLGAAASEPRL